MTLIFLGVAWLLGILTGWAVDSSPVPCLAVAGAALAAAAVLGRARPGAHRPALVIAMVALGWARGAWDTSASKEETWAVHHAKDVTLQGWVAKAPDVRATYTQLTVQAVALQVDDEWQTTEGRVLVRAPHYAGLEYGDEVVFSGRLEQPPQLEGFDYRAYLAARGVYALMYRANLERVRVRAGPHVRVVRAALRLKESLRGVILAVLPGAEAGLLSGILLGLDHTLPGELDDAFRRVGLTHIIVISGFNISLLAQVFLLSGAVLRRKRALCVALLGVVVYGAFVGLTPPVARAVLMGLVWLGAGLAGRRSHSLTSLALATTVMTAANPLQLRDVSFQLSFASTMGLLLVEPVLAQGLVRWAERTDSPLGGRVVRLVRDLVLVTVAAQLVTLPVIWYHFRELSVVSLLANLLVLFVQPGILVLGAVATMLGWVSISVGRVAAWGVWPLLRYTTWVTEELGRLPWASRPVPELPSWAAVAFYVLVAGAVVVAHRLRSETDCAAPAFRKPTTGASMEPETRPNAEPLRTLERMGFAALSLLCFLVWAAVFSLPDGHWHLYFLDVGQGDAILIRSPGGRTVLVDGGPDPVLLNARLGRVLPFWQRHVDIVVATHVDSDHLAGLIPVVDRYIVGCALEPPYMGDEPLPESWRQGLHNRDVPLLPAASGMSVWFGDEQVIEVLHPMADLRGPVDANSASLVLRVTAGETVALLTADIDTRAEDELLRRGVGVEAQVLKVAHHGSAGSTSRPWLEAVSPRIAVISTGVDNSFGHPSAAVLERLHEAGVQIWRTDTCGTVEVVTDGRGLWVRTTRECAPVAPRGAVAP